MSEAAQRTTSVGIFTRAGWVTGMLHIAAGRDLGWYLDGDDRFFRLTEVQLPAEAAPREFFAMYADEALMVVPFETGEQFVPVTEGAKRKDIGCLLAEGTLFGSLDVPPDARVSDYLMSGKRFIPIRRCRTPLFELPPELAEPIEMIYLNSKKIIGVTESNPIESNQARLVNPYLEA
ncbi:MAG: hypothetical protein HYU52_05960 [Acidobacteria bacterium]|nr:hypothetical protein [Acidobacteriota bacterium]